ncbi:MAG TPA: serine hydrolase domain-containing protein [Puia sp.]|nr:serine hydrolase domain-containing protein [Puia sp.]
MRWPAPILLTLSALVNGACQCQPDKKLERQLDSAFTAVFKSNEPGGAIFIRQGNTILYDKSFGLADMTTKEKFTNQTVSNLGSISKTFVAYAILLLQSQGNLSVEDSILKYFPEFKNKKIASRIKIKNLLMHTSGLPDSREVDKDSVFYLTANDAENFKPLTLTDTLEFEPGTKWNYSNPAYNGLALIIEKITKNKWQNFVIRNIFQPSGMTHSKITDGSYPDKGVAHGYILENGKWREYDYGEYPTFDAAGNGGVWSSIEDLKKYVAAIKEYKFLNRKQVDSSKQVLWSGPALNAKDTVSRSLVWFIRKNSPLKKDQEPYTMIEHSGDQGGFMAHLIMIPEEELTIIWLTNNGRYITPGILDALHHWGYLY